MAKKQTRRSISVSRPTYDRLKAFCQTNNVSMSQFVETRVGALLGGSVVGFVAPSLAAINTATAAPRSGRPALAASPESKVLRMQMRPPAPVAPPLTRDRGMSLAAAARAALAPRVVIAITDRERSVHPKTPIQRTADQIFTF